MTSIIEANKAVIFARLADLGIAKVLIHYDGADDSGCIEGITLSAADGENVKLGEAKVDIDTVVSNWDGEQQKYVDTIERRSITVERAVEGWCYDLLALHLGGWENDDGACGDISLDIPAGTGVIEHRTRVTEYLHDEVEV